MTEMKEILEGLAVNKWKYYWLKYIKIVMIFFQKIFLLVYQSTVKMNVPKKEAFKYWSYQKTGLGKLLFSGSLKR